MGFPSNRNFDGHSGFWFRGFVPQSIASLICARLMVPLKKLSTYRKKRDFEKTAEPSGQTPVKPSKRRRFVIQKHAATRLHYDLRLHEQGLFYPAAETKAPGLDPRLN